MREVFIVDGLRTPFCSFGGNLSSIEAPKLASFVIKELMNKTKLPKDAVSEIIIGNVLQAGIGQAPARQAMIYANLPENIPAMTINKVCGSGLKSVMLAFDSILLGNADIVIAGGMENMSLAPYYLKKARFGYRMGNGGVYDGLVHDGLWDPYGNVHMGNLAENVANKHGITRKEQDDYAIRSYKLSKKAQEKDFRDEIVPITIKIKKVESIIDKDEDPFRVDFEKIPSLKTVFKRNGTITAANASTISDGAALCLVASGSAVEKYSLSPLAKIVAHAQFSTKPALFPEAPVGAIKSLLKKTGLGIGDIDLFEINEAFATVVLVAQKELEIDLDKININGGAISIGHPIGASGGRLVLTLAKQLKKRNKKYGIATLCIGGGEAVAMLLESL